MSTTTKKRAPRTAAKKTTAKKATTERARVKKVTTVTEIREHAFYLFMNRGGEPGHELDDWLQAERDLNGTRVAA